eukprot:5662320-Alexandrium_andersonii.AAC.1
MSAPTFALISARGYWSHSRDILHRLLPVRIVEPRPGSDDDPTVCVVVPPLGSARNVLHPRECHQLQAGTAGGPPGQLLPHPSC